MNKNNIAGMVIGIILAAGLVAVVSKTFHTAPVIKKDPDILLIEAKPLGVQNSHTMATIYSDIEKVNSTGILSLVIFNHKLDANTLGQTQITLSNNKIICTVSIDVDKALRAGDRLEPLLGHELKHVWDALFLYDNKDPMKSAQLFIDSANASKVVTYKNREVEASAIKVEDTIRKELIESKNEAFLHLPESRQAAEALYSFRSKVDATLKQTP